MRSSSNFFGCIYLWLFTGLVTFTGVLSDENPQDFFSKASCDFAIDLLKAQSNLTEDNVILSPNSVGTLLAILQMGAKENTLKQIDSVLHMTGDQAKVGYNLVLKSLQREKRNVTLEWGNRAYIRPGFELSDVFNSTIQETFNAVIQELNFVEPSPQEAADVINNWVREVTHDIIKSLIPSSVLSSDTAFILLNAIYFKGLWDVPFSKLLTKEEKFETSPNNTVQVPFMYQKERFIAGEDPESGLLWVDLPFKDEQFSMLFLLPSERHGLDKVYEKLTGDLLLKIIKDKSTRQVKVTIPKFKLGEKVQLSKPLQELGLSDIFTEDANFEGITPNFKHLAVSKIIHQANVEIDEDGTTAAAATGIVFQVTSFVISNQLTFTADHPFLFFILDRMNNIPLFIGKVTDPSKTPL